MLGSRLDIAQAAFTCTRHEQLLQILLFLLLLALFNLISILFGLILSKGVHNLRQHKLHSEERSKNHHEAEEHN